MRLVQPTVSVVIPTYNRAAFLKCALESALSQTYEDFEVIVVDDGSTDRTWTVVESYGTQVRYHRCAVRQGSAGARNIGIELARGKYVAFLDSDDLWLPRKLDLQLDSLMKAPSPLNTVCYCQVINDYGTVTVLSSSKPLQTGEHIAEFLFKRAPLLQTSSLILSRNLALSTLFDPKARQYDDWDFCIRLYAKGAQFVMVQEPLVVFFNSTREDRVSIPPDSEVLLSWLDSSRALISEKARKRILAHRAWVTYKDGQKSRALRAILTAALSGAVSPVEATLFLMRCLLPRHSIRIYHRLRSMVPKRGSSIIRKDLQGLKDQALAQ